MERSVCTSCFVKPYRYYAVNLLLSLSGLSPLQGMRLVHKMKCTGNIYNGVWLQIEPYSLNFCASGVGTFSSNTHTASVTPRYALAFFWPLELNFFPFSAAAGESTTGNNAARQQEKTTAKHAAHCTNKTQSRRFAQCMEKFLC